MPRKLTGVLAAVAAGVIMLLVAPAGALACGGAPSAQNIYVECQPTASGGKSINGSPGSTPTTGNGANSAKLVKIPHRISNKISRAGGKDASVLKALVENPGYGAFRGLRSNRTLASVTPPTALAAAVDLGSGPTTLLAILAASAFLLLLATGWRGWRGWRRSRGHLTT